MQRFSAREKFLYPNGAIGWSPGGPFDCLGPYAKVQNCPIEGMGRCYTVYAQSAADTFFSIPAATRIHGRIVKGYFGRTRDDGIMFYPFNGQLAETDGFRIWQECIKSLWLAAEWNGERDAAKYLWDLADSP